MDRTTAIQTALSYNGGSTYLEIGVDAGHCFSRVSAQRKIGVDPQFAAGSMQRLIPGRLGREVHCFQTTSDAFFAAHGQMFDRDRISVALVDGLHTYRQSLKDVENCLRHLDDDGIIVMHDCNPTRRLMAAPSESYEDYLRTYVRGWSALLARNHAWTGDVWKTVVHLRSLRSDVQVAVLDCDRGVGLVRKAGPRDMLDYSPGDIDGLSYSDLEADRKALLNLKPPEYLETFLRGRRDHEGPPVRNVG